MIDNGRMNPRATRDQLERVALELALATAGGNAMMRRHGLG